MSWYKPLSYRHNLIICLGFILLAFSSCRPGKIAGKKSYFDLKGFFRLDSARLSKIDKVIIKTVTHNGKAETKKVHIPDWGAELSLFSQSDINKPAWQSSYSILDSDSLILYKAKDAELRTRQVLIKKDHGKVKWIMIYNHDKNMLYETKEELSYFPDSLYLIQRSQHVKILGTNTYKVKGLLSGAR